MELNYFILNLFLCSLCFFSLITLQALFINGIHTSAAGETEKLPDGTEKDSEMIFYPIKKWLTKTRQRQVFYRGEELDKFIESIRQRYPLSVPTMEFNYPEGQIKFFTEEAKTMFVQLFSKIQLQEDKLHIIWAGNVASLFKVYDVPVRSKWLRKPLIECIKCMASFWGSVTYWPLLLYIFGFQWWQLPLWVADVIILTFVNWYWYKKVS